MPSLSLKEKAYAKINLTLDVTGRREDGYHLLDSVMQTVSLWDDVVLCREEAPGIRLKTNQDYLPVDEKNTAYRAAELFFDYADAQKGQAWAAARGGVSIAIEKRIPSRAGLGGGSADAAAVLRGLNRLFDCNFPQDSLLPLGRQVGADVPFCIRGGTSRCQGVGELLTPCAPLPPCTVVICKPPAGMSTPRAYAQLDRYPLKKTGATPAMLEALSAGDLTQVGKRLSNRFDDTIHLMQVVHIKSVFHNTCALGCLMTGSGSAVYGLFPSPEKAQTCAQLLESHGEVFLTQPVGESEVNLP